MHSSSDGGLKNGVGSVLASWLPMSDPPIVTHHDSMARRTMYGLHTVTGQTTSSLAGRPFYVFWFMGQIMRLVAATISCFDS